MLPDERLKEFMYRAWAYSLSEGIDALKALLTEAIEEERNLLTRIADANVVFPSMCANNGTAYTLVRDLEKYRSQPKKGAP